MCHASRVKRSIGKFTIPLMAGLLGLGPREVSLDVSRVPLAIQASILVHNSPKAPGRNLPTCPCQTIHSGQQIHRHPPVWILRLTDRSFATDSETNTTQPPTMQIPHSAPKPSTSSRVEFIPGKCPRQTSANQEEGRRRAKKAARMQGHL